MHRQSWHQTLSAMSAMSALGADIQLEQRAVICSSRRTRSRIRSSSVLVPNLAFLTPQDLLTEKCVRPSVPVCLEASSVSSTNTMAHCLSPLQQLKIDLFFLSPSSLLIRPILPPSSPHPCVCQLCLAVRCSDSHSTALYSWELQLQGLFSAIFSLSLLFLCLALFQLHLCSFLLHALHRQKFPQNAFHCPVTVRSHLGFCHH